MAVPVVPFRPGHALELVLYVAKRLSRPTFHTISKVLYFADREHLSRYGSLMTGDTYYAMQHGPVPGGVYDLLKAAAGRGGAFVSPAWADLARRALAVEGRWYVRALREPDMSMIPASQRKCLDTSIQRYGRLSFDRLTRESHDAAWKSAGPNDIIELAAIAKTLPNAREILGYLSAEESGGDARQRVPAARAA